MNAQTLCVSESWDSTRFFNHVLKTACGSNFQPLYCELSVSIHSSGCCGRDRRNPMWQLRVIHGRPSIGIFTVKGLRCQVLCVLQVGARWVSSYFRTSLMSSKSLKVCIMVISHWPVSYYCRGASPPWGFSHAEAVKMSTPSFVQVSIADLDVGLRLIGRMARD